MSTPRLLAMFACSLLLSVPALAQRKVELDKEQKIKQWGYSIRTLKGWNSIPADQESRFTVGRWKLSLDDFEKRGDWEALQGGQLAELQIIRIAPKVETPSGEQPAAAPEPEEKPQSPAMEALAKRMNPTTMEDWIEGRFPDASQRWLRKPLKGSKTPGDLIEFNHGATSVAIGYFRRFGVEWAVVYTAFEEHYRKTWQTAYLKSIQSFEVENNVDPDVANAARKDIAKLEGDEKREALKASIAGNPGWYAVDSDHYVFLSNSKQRGFIERLARDLEVVREKAFVKDFPPRTQKIPLSPVRVLDTQSEYHQYGGPGGSAGYFSPVSGELVLFTKFQEMSTTSSLDLCRSVMYHEGFHQYIHFAVGDVSPHSWFNEGHGDYFAGIGLAGTSVRVKPFEWRVDFLKTHMRDKGDLVPLRSLLRFPQREYYTNAGLKYSQGWALIYFLREVTTDKRRKQALDLYFKHLADNVTAFRAKKKDKDGNDPSGRVPGIPGIRIIDFEDEKQVTKILAEAVDIAFEGIDLEELDRDLRSWIQGL